MTLNFYKNFSEKVDFLKIFFSFRTELVKFLFFKLEKKEKGGEKEEKGGKKDLREKERKKRRKLEKSQKIILKCA